MDEYPLLQINRERKSCIRELPLHLDLWVKDKFLLQESWDLVCLFYFSITFIEIVDGLVSSFLQE